MSRAHWTDEMVARARSMRRKGGSYREIDAALGVGNSATWSKLKSLDATPEQKQRHREMVRNWAKRNTSRPEGTPHHSPEPRRFIPPEILQAQLARCEAYDRRTSSQSICGEPPIGYSALDQKNGRTNVR